MYRRGGVAIKLIFPVEVVANKKGIEGKGDKWVIVSLYRADYEEPCNFPDSASKKAIYPTFVPTITNLDSG